MWNVRRDRIIQPHEIATVLASLNSTSPNGRMNRIVFRLSTCCGLRASEMAQLRLSDVRLDSTRPDIVVRPEVGKGKRGRIVPITWDSATLADITSWKAWREAQGAGDLFLCSQARSSLGRPLERRGLRSRFIRACKVLGAQRKVSIHDGRHTFISLAIYGGKNILAVRDAAGHSSLGTTSLYCHLVEKEEPVGNLFHYV